MNEFDLILRNVTVVTPEGERLTDVGIADGKIVSFAGGSAREEIDATGLHVFPGVMDSHVHFNEPGRADWEGIETGSRALAAGGGTVFFDMPLNAHPPTCDAESFHLKRAAAERNSLTDFAFWGGLVPGNLDKLEELAACGVIGFKAFMSDSGIEDFPCVDHPQLKEGMKIAAQLGKLVSVHAESEAITSRLSATAIMANRTTIRDYLDSRPIYAEVEAIHRAIQMANDTKCALHIVHVSSGAGVALIASAQNQGVDVTCETCPHYLVMTEADLERIGALAKCAPPLRTPSAQAVLWRYLESGHINTVGSDHSPSPPEMKLDPNFFKVWGGISGVQHTLPLLLTHVAAGILPAVEPGFQPVGKGVDEKGRVENLPSVGNLGVGPGGKMPPSTAGRMPAATARALISNLLSANVARRFQIPNKGKIAVGFDADFALVDLKKSFTVAKSDLLYRHPHSPYVGRALTGRVVQTILRGKTIFKDGKTIGTNRGQLIKPL